MKTAEYQGLEIPPVPEPLKPVIAPDYMIMRRPGSYALPALKRNLSIRIGQVLGVGPVELHEPSRSIAADLAVDCYPLSRATHETPSDLAEKAAADLNGAPASATTVNGFVNLTLDRESLSRRVLKEVESEGPNYGRQNIGNGATVFIEHSAPTVGLPMNFGHLRSALIGDSLKRIYRSCGFKVITDMHQSDWNNQIGMFMRVSDQLGLLRDMPSDLSIIHKKMEEERRSTGLSMAEIEGWQFLKRLEAGDLRASKIMKWITRLSMEEFEKIYKTVGIDFNYAVGDSAYVSMVPGLVKELAERGIATDTRGALSIDLDDVGLGGLVMQRTGGLSTYGSRDLAALIARGEWFNPQKILYIAGSDRIDYYKQLFETYNRFAGSSGPELQHIQFGFVTLMGAEKISPVFLEPVFREAVRKARGKNEGSSSLTDSSERDRVAEMVGIGALKFYGLSHSRDRELKLDIDEVLSRDEYTGTYIQYAHARAAAITQRADAEGVVRDDYVDPRITTDLEFALLKQIAGFPEAVNSALQENRPSRLAQHIYNIASAFNQFHTRNWVLGSEGAVLNTRLRLVAATGQVISNGLELLGIEAPPKM